MALGEAERAEAISGRPRLMNDVHDVTKIACMQRIARATLRRVTNPTEYPMTRPDVDEVSAAEDRALEKLLERAAAGDREAEEVLIRASAEVLQRIADG